MKWTTILACLLPTMSIAEVKGLPDLHCAGMRELVALLERGPDAVVQRVLNESEAFIKGTMPGWICLPEPYPPERNGRVFLEGISCFKPIEHGTVSESERGQLGLYFARQIDTLFVCFEDEVITEAPTNLDQGDTFKESLLVALDRGRAGHKISADLSYGRGIAGQPLYVGLDLRYGVVRPPDSTLQENQALCDEVTDLISHASVDFRRLRDGPDRDNSDSEVASYFVKRKQARAQSCSIDIESDSADHRCQWRFPTPEAARQDFQAKLLQLQRCPAIGVEASERPSRVRERQVFFSLSGPFTVSLTLETKRRNQVALRLTHWKE